MSSDGPPPATITSSLSTKELAVLPAVGARPLGLVLGASVGQIGWSNLPSEAGWAGDDFTFALHTVEEAWSLVYRQATTRMSEEARRLGAQAVLGVSVVRGEHAWTRHSADLVMSGTAVRLSDESPGSTVPDPVLSDLSVQDFWTLQCVGVQPVGLVWATSAVFISPGRGTRLGRRHSWATNQEMREFSDGFTQARHSTIARLNTQARSLSADGIVGVRIDYGLTEKTLTIDRRGAAPSGLSSASLSMGANPADFQGGGSDDREGQVITFHATGTAIRRHRPEPAGPASIPRPRLDLAATSPRAGHTWAHTV